MYKGIAEKERISMSHKSTTQRFATHGNSRLADPDLSVELTLKSRESSFVFKDELNQETTLNQPSNSWLIHIDPKKSIFRERSYSAIKRFMDLVIIGVCAPVWAPLVVLCTLAIKLGSPRAPAFFVQWRTGKGGRRFGMYKFRTMVENAAELKRELGHLNELQPPDFKITNDPRVTFIGRILRKTSLDELPQVFNVIRGEMSLVGPRPTSFSSLTYDLWQTERLDVIPGVTGLWQIVARGSTEFDVRIRMDIEYIERRCLWLDIQILFRTIPSILLQRGVL